MGGEQLKYNIFNFLYKKGYNWRKMQFLAYKKGIRIGSESLRNYPHSNDSVSQAKKKKRGWNVSPLSRLVPVLLILERIKTDSGYQMIPKGMVFKKTVTLFY